jgi:glycosyltransferase involved in cell wall biosynthesis
MPPEESADLHEFQVRENQAMQLTLAIPNRNGARFLTDTLESLAANRPHVRWWFQDCCSTDDSVALARSFATDNDTIVSEPDSGQADALNRAFRGMGGTIVGFLNSDDCLVPGAAEYVLETFDREPDVDLVYGGIEVIDEAGSVIRVHHGDISNLSEVLSIYEVWWKQRQWVQPEVFWRRSLTDRVGGFNTGLDLVFDYEYWVRCFMSGVRVKKLPRVLSKFRLHANQKSSQSAQAAREIRSVVSGVLEQNPPIPESEARQLRRMLSYDCYWAGDRGAESGIRPAFGAMLLRNPLWLSLPLVRERLRMSLLSRVRPHRDDRRSGRRG